MLLDVCESWVHDLSGTKQNLVSLNPRLFGLPPRPQLLAPVLLRQLKLKLQDEPYGSEENNFVSGTIFVLSCISSEINCNCH